MPGRAQGWLDASEAVHNWQCGSAQTAALHHATEAAAAALAACRGTRRPHLDTVAGDACARPAHSNMKFTLGPNWMRSPLGSVSSLWQASSRGCFVFRTIAPQQGPWQRRRRHSPKNAGTHAPVVVQHAVEGLDPFRVNVAVTHHPTWLVGRCGGHLQPKCTCKSEDSCHWLQCDHAMCHSHLAGGRGEHAVRPLACVHVEAAQQLAARQRFWVQPGRRNEGQAGGGATAYGCYYLTWVCSRRSAISTRIAPATVAAARCSRVDLRPPPQLCHRAREAAPQRRLAAAGGPDQDDADALVARQGELQRLRDLEAVFARRSAVRGCRAGSARQTAAQVPG